MPKHPPCTLSSLTTFFENQANPKIQCVNLTTNPTLSKNQLIKDQSRASGGGDRIRTRDLLGASEMLFQLSYAPNKRICLVLVRKS